MSKEDYLAWLQLAQQTAWLEYTKINPRAQRVAVRWCAISWRASTTRNRPRRQERPPPKVG